MPPRQGRSIGKRREFEEYERGEASGQSSKDRRLIDTTFPKTYMKRAVSDTGRILTETGQRKVDRRAYSALTPAQQKAYDRAGYKRGGKVRRTGLAMVHRGERVLTAKQNRKLMRRKRGRRK